MLVELKICADPKWISHISACDLSLLSGRVDLPATHDRARILIEFIQEGTDPLQFIAERENNPRRAIVIVSPKLVSTAVDKLALSTTASRLNELAWGNSVVLGLIGLTELSQDDHVPGLDGLLDRNAIQNDLAGLIARLIRQLWYKLPPPRCAAKTGKQRRFIVKGVDDKATFRHCLALRHTVYSALGYLERPIENARSQIEFDCYDGQSLHFAVLDTENKDRVVGTMRLIVPGRSFLNQYPLSTQTLDFGQWCNEFANEEPRPYKRILRRPPPSALPLCDSFRYFRDLKDRPKYEQLIYPNDACEVSRVVVHPDYRGHGILGLLMNEAIKAAQDARKRHLLLECAPFHEAMYRRFGFLPIEDRGRRYYVRAQRLDAWAVAMYRKTGGNAAEKTTGEVYRLPIERENQVHSELAISHEDLTREQIARRLSRSNRYNSYTFGTQAYVAKGAVNELSARIKTAFAVLSAEILPVMREIYDRIPRAEVRLISGSEEYALRPNRLGDETSAALVNDIKKWFEGLSVTV